MNLKTLASDLKPLMFTGQSLSSCESDYARYYGISSQSITAVASHEMGYLDCHLYRIGCHIYRPVTPAQSKGTFFLLHGYYDHVGLFRHIIRYLLEQGYCVFAYDLPGHGLSTGKSASIPDFSDYGDVLADILDHCTGQLPQPWHAYGQSTGGAILTQYLLGLSRQSHNLPFSQLILSAPLVRPYGWSTGRIRFYLLRPFIKEIPRKFSKNSRDQVFLAFAKEDPLAPRALPVEWVSAMNRWIKQAESAKETIKLSPLIIQGTDDRTADAHYNMASLKRLYSEPRVLLLEGARHHLPNELESTRKEYMSWLSSLL